MTVLLRNTGPQTRVIKYNIVCKKHGFVKTNKNYICILEPDFVSLGGMLFITLANIIYLLLLTRLFKFTYCGEVVVVVQR